MFSPPSVLFKKERFLRNRELESSSVITELQIFSSSSGVLTGKPVVGGAPTRSPSFVTSKAEFI